MREFSTVELTQKIGDVTHVARKEPVAITQHRKPRFVLMSIEDYQQLRKDADPRRSYRVEDTPDDLLEEMEAALASYEAQEL